MDFSTSNAYATDLIPCPKLFKEWQPCFSIINLKSDIKIMVFYWERFLKPRSTALALPLCCITATWQGEVETELCQLPLHVGRILLVLSIMSPTRVKFRMNKYNYKSFDPTMMTNMFWLNLYNRVCFFPNCASAAQEFRAKFLELQRQEAVKCWFANSQVFILLHTIVTASASSYAYGVLQNLQKSIGHWKHHCIWTQNIWRNWEEHPMLDRAKHIL